MSVRLYAVRCGGELTKRVLFDTFDDDPGAVVEIPYFFYVVQHPRGNVLFDSGAHPGLVTDPRARLGAAADSFEVRMAPGDDVVSKLAKIGMKPTDFGHVVHSHLHYDHCGGIELLPRSASYLIQKSELPFAYWPPVYQRIGYVRADFDHPVKWKELSGEYDVFDDGTVVVIPTPGHTPGHQSLLVRLDSQVILILADVAYSMEKMRARALPAVLWNPDALVDTWGRVEELESRLGAMLVCTHDPSQLATLRMAPDAWYE